MTQFKTSSQNKYKTDYSTICTGVLQKIGYPETKVEGYCSYHPDGTFAGIMDITGKCLWFVDEISVKIETELQKK